MRRKEYFTKVSIKLVSPASGENTSTAFLKTYRPSFHSISFPSEWGVLENHHDSIFDHCLVVSIQLVSPASGEL